MTDKIRRTILLDKWSGPRTDCIHSEINLRWAMSPGIIDCVVCSTRFGAEFDEAAGRYREGIEETRKRRKELVDKRLNDIRSKAAEMEASIERPARIEREPTRYQGTTEELIEDLKRIGSPELAAFVERRYNHRKLPWYKRWFSNKSEWDTL